MLLFNPHPPLRGTLSLQERDSLQIFFHFRQLCLSQEGGGTSGEGAPGWFQSRSLAGWRLWDHRPFPDVGSRFAIPLPSRLRGAVYDQQISN
jgi:hypothetical protein